MKPLGFQENLEALCNKTSRQLLKYLIKQILFVCGASLLIALEFSFFLYFFLFSGKTVIPAFCLACFFLTLFVCLVTRLYLLSGKGDFFEDLASEYLQGAVPPNKRSQNIVEEQSHLAAAATKLSINLQNQEYSLLSEIFKFLPKHDLIRKFSCFCFWKDYFLFRECLLQKAIEAYIKVVQAIPVDLSAHVSLADAYVALSGLYADPRKYPEFDANYWIPSGRYSAEIQEKFFATARRAIEEFQILNEYAPGNAWVHAQLAYSYHDLQMPMEEIQEYEIVLKLKPNDVETMSKLGILYFQQGMNAKGLRIYEEIKKRDYKKSQKLIKFYGVEYKY
ncbi:hypothetical protein CpB0626 [Chlamydia pneumoniae TW-183]|uniref:Uncharacterized protein n=2 Tax=Chlamydia pneumoniae TaxID=83558 RepID=Q9Z7V2_CHLPN|nr:hypothetical protein [Chlamydia pneumoniae]AAD18741.1 CT484 hypothetical protein [Chlamydia pneumoniae CWL029]AAF38027.1 conserved hypothetical protein [Chlamydia pneumoniae AR39]AAP98555.1 hypothetical protein CpB0626 [Chlamydia pneumoniae TW-183]CRI33118.1 Uncharacterized protein BN1224_Wien1_A_06250 [Chlamydia pneumoniae]CRI35981.1 Uncharacterized protein BN1224_CM1_A_06280 [Chlamydia pneumoniae]